MKIQPFIQYDKDEYTTVLCGYRQSGRTTKLLELAEQSALKGYPTYIVCPNLMQAKNISMRLNLRNYILSNYIRLEHTAFFCQVYIQTKIKFNERKLFADNIEWIGSGRTPLDIDEKAVRLCQDYVANHITFTVEG